MKKSIFILFSIIFIILISCGQNSENKNNVTKLDGAPAPFDGSKKVHFALIRQALEGEFLQMWQTGSQRQADLMGIQLTVLGKNMDNQAQADFIYQAINMKVDGIILDNGFAETLTEPINEAVKLGIPVVSIEVNIPNPAINRITLDNYSLAKNSLDALNKDFNGQANIGYVYLSGQPSLDARDEAFVDFKKEFPNMKEIARSGTLESPFSVKNAEQVKAVLKANPQINAYFAPFDEFAKGVVLALEEYRLTDKVKVYSIDISTQDIELMIKDGSPWVATATANPTQAGALCVRALALKVAGEKIPQNILIESHLFTQDMLREAGVKNMEELEIKFPDFNKTTNMTASWIPMIK